MERVQYTRTYLISLFSFALIGVMMAELVGFSVVLLDVQMSLARLALYESSLVS